MRRRRFLTIAGVAVAGTGCLASGATASLRVENASETTRTVHVEVGGTITPDGTPPPGRTKTPIGRDRVYVERTLSLDPGERETVPDVLELPDHEVPTGVTVDVEGGPRTREPVRLGPTAEGTLIVVTIRPGDVAVTVEPPPD